MEGAMSYIMTDEFNEKMNLHWEDYDFNCEDAIAPIKMEDRPIIREYMYTTISRLVEKKSSVLSNLEKMDRSPTLRYWLVKKKIHSIVDDIVDIYSKMEISKTIIIERMDSCEPSSPESAYVDMDFKQFRSIASEFESIIDGFITLQNSFLYKTCGSSIFRTSNELNTMSNNLIIMKMNLEATT